MKKPIAFGILFAGILASVAAVLQSGWTSTTNPATARTALGVPGLAVNNSFSGGNTFTSGVTNDSAAGFKGNGAGLTNLSAAIWTGSVGTSNYVAKFAGGNTILNSGIFENGAGNVGIGTTTPTSGRLVVDGGGITFGTDNTYDIGASGANRPNDIFAGGQGVFSGGGTGTPGLNVGGMTLIVTNGNVGIGTLTPGAKLDVVGAFTVSGGFTTTGANSDTPGAGGGIQLDNGFTTLRNSINHNFHIDSYNVGSPLSVATFTQGGNVGIGTDAPNAKLQVVGDANIRTNIAQFDVTITDFVIGTRYTNSNRRAFVAASFQLAAAGAGTAAVTMNVEQAGTTNKLTVSSGPLAGLTTIEPLALPVGPGAFYYFTDTSSGAGAVASIVAGTSSLTGF